jgi:hypothetical protein
MTQHEREADAVIIRSMHNRCISEEGEEDCDCACCEARCSCDEHFYTSKANRASNDAPCP